MADRLDGTGTAPVTDRRPVPRGVLPRGVQTWLMAALAIGMLLIIFVTGQPESTPATTPTAPAAQATDPDRVREYQNRLRALDAQAAQDALTTAAAGRSVPPSFDNDVQGAPQVDPLVADRRRRDYESLFANNLVLSRRPDAQRPDHGTTTLTPTMGAGAQGRQEPSIDDVAEAVVRATSRSNGAVPGAGSQAAPAAADAPSPSTFRPAPTPPISPTGPAHRVPEGTIVDAVLTNRLDGSAASPVNCMVTNPIYSHTGSQVLIPAGARILGETKPVQTLGESRLAVVFHRLLMPDGSAVALDQFRGLNQIGDSGLRDRVNRHYWSTFGAAGAVGLVSGLAQRLGTAGIGGGSGDRTVLMAGSGAEAMAQASMQVMNRFLNQLPTVTIREGHRVKVYVTSDLDLPAWTPETSSGVHERR